MRGRRIGIKREKCEFVFCSRTVFFHTDARLNEWPSESDHGTFTFEGVTAYNNVQGLV